MLKLNQVLILDVTPFEKKIFKVEPNMVECLN